MSPLELLAPDQRAVVALVLQRRRSYDDIAAVLGIPVDAVRARAHAGLDALAPENGLPPEITGPLADFLLGQQPGADAEATRGLLAESAPARAWATGVAARLGDVAPGPLPEIPGGAVDPGAALDTAADRAPATPDTAAEALETAPATPDTAAEALETAPATPDTAAEALDEPPAGADQAPAPRAANRAPDVPAPRPRPVREAAVPAGTPPPTSSKVGGVLLIAGVIAIVGVVLFLVLRGGDDPAGEEAASASPTPAATATATATPEAQVTDQITLRPPNGGKAEGTMTVYLQGGQLLFAVQGENLAATGEQDAYAIWLTGPDNKARRLGFTGPVGEDGALGVQGPEDKDLDAFPQLYATYEKVVVSHERTNDPKRPGNVVLAGRLPAGR